MSFKCGKLDDFLAIVVPKHKIVSFESAVREKNVPV